MTTEIKFTKAALENIEETGTDPQDDIDAVASGDLTEGSLLADVLDGADEDRVQGWRDYVAAIMAAVAAQD